MNTSLCNTIFLNFQVWQGHVCFQTSHQKQDQNLSCPMFQTISLMHSLKLANLWIFLNNLTENLTIILIFLFINWFKINRSYIGQVIRLAMVSMVVALGQATSYGCSFLRFNSQTFFVFFLFVIYFWEISLLFSRISA